MKYFKVIFIVLLFGCDNQEKISESKNNSQDDVNEIHLEKQNYQIYIDSLNEEISELNIIKNEVSNEIEYSYANIYDILNNSYLDHIIIGSYNLIESERIMSNLLGFSIKEGRKHSNGLSNFFIEFEDSSEIEFMNIDHPTNQLAQDYKNSINSNRFGLQFAIRTNKIEELNSAFQQTKSIFSNFLENKIFSTISQSRISEEKPFFIIKYLKSQNSQTDHDNRSKGLQSIWLATPEIRTTIKQYAEFGFLLIDTISVANIKSKTALMKNKNFEIIVIESDNYSILGCTITLNSISVLKERLDSKLNFNNEIIGSKRGKSIYLSPEITKSIWFEFIEN